MPGHTWFWLLCLRSPPSLWQTFLKEYSGKMVYLMKLLSILIYIDNYSGSFFIFFHDIYLIAVVILSIWTDFRSLNDLNVIHSLYYSFNLICLGQLFDRLLMLNSIYINFLREGAWTWACNFMCACKHNLRCRCEQCKNSVLDLIFRSEILYFSMNYEVALSLKHEELFYRKSFLYAIQFYAHNYS